MPQVIYDPTTGQAIAEAPSTPIGQGLSSQVPPPAPAPTFKTENPAAAPGQLTVYSPDGQAVPMDLEAAQKALLSGQFGMPEGQGVPIRLNGQIGTVPLKQLHDALAQGGQVVPQDAYENAALQHDYGDVAHGLETFGYNFLNSALLDVPSEFLDEDERKTIRNMNAANPVSKTVGSVAGIAAPIIADVASGGALTPFVAPEAAGALRLGELGADALEAGRAASLADVAGQGLKTAGTYGMKAFTAPSSAVSRLGDLVEAGVAKLVGEDATSLMGRMAQKGLQQAARGAVEMPIYGAADAWGEDNLKDKPELTGEKLWNIVSNDFWSGAALGGIFGVGGAAMGKLTDRAIGGYLAPKLEAKANEHLFSLIDPEGKLADLSQTEKSAIRREFMASGVIKGGERVQDVAPRVDDLAEKARAGLKAVFSDPLVDKLPGVGARDLTNLVDEHLVETKLSALGKEGIDVTALKKQIREMVGLPDIEKEYPGIRKEYLDQLADKPIPYKQAVGLADEIARAAEKETNPVVKAALHNLSNGMEDLMDKEVDKQISAEVSKATEAMKKGPPPKSDAETVGRYYDAISSLDKNIDAYRALQQKIGQSRDVVRLMDRVQESMQDAIAKESKRKGGLEHFVEKAGGIGAALGGLHGLGAGVAHIGLGAAAGAVPAILVAKIAKTLIEQRGKSTAAVILDKLATIGAVRRTANAVDWKIARVVQETGKRSSRVAEETVATNKVFDKYKRIMEKWDEDEQVRIHNAARVKNFVLPWTIHAPSTAQAFQSAAERSMAYLQQNYPRVPPNPSMPNPKWDKREPSEQQKYAAARTWSNVTDPTNVLRRVVDGTLSTKDIQDVKTTHPQLYSYMQVQLAQHMASMPKPPTPDVLRAMNIFIGRPGVDPTLASMMQKSYQNTASGQQGGAGAPAGGGKKGAPKRELSLPAELTGLTGLNKSLKL